MAQDDAYYSTLRQQWQDQYQLSGGEWVIGGTESDVLAQTNYYGNLTVTQETVTGQDFSQAVRIQSTQRALLPLVMPTILCRSKPSTRAMCCC